MTIFNQGNEKGFTLVEVLVISPIMLVVVGAVVTFLFNQFGQMTKLNGQLNLQLEAQNILFNIQEDLWYAQNFVSDLNSNLNDPYQPQGGWRSSTTPPTLLTSNASLTTSPRDANRQPVYINEAGCSPPDGNGDNSVLFNNYIYFASGTNLYKRIVSAPSTLALCSTPYEKQSCPAANASASCPADRILSDHLNTFSVTYYDTNNGVVTTPENAESVKVDIGLKDKAFGEDIFASSSLRIRKINQ